MGSLMAGWDSPVPDPQAVKYRRNRSLTKDGIEAYWRSKKEKEEEHLRAISDLSPNTLENTVKESEIRYQRSNSLPLANTKENFVDKESTESSLEKLIDKNGWWISSNWAFLNEPPVIASEGPTYKYASQFHVADLASSKPHPPSGISTT